MVVASLLAVGVLNVTAHGALVFGINGSTSPAVVNLTNGSPSVNLTIGIRSTIANSGGELLDAFAFRLRSSNGAVASFTGVSFVGGNTGVNSSASGATATAQGAWANGTRILLSDTTFINLATITLTGLSTGNTTVTIEELTAGTNSDVRTSSDNIGTLITDQDADAFSGGTAGGFRFATTSGGFTAAITAVPEPSSILLVSSVAAAVGYRFRRRTRKL